MIRFFSKTNIGYLHIKNKKPCQDYSLSYHDEERTIVCVADGHGGDLYIRSDRGSRFACNALLTAFRSVDGTHMKASAEDLLRYIKLYALAEWNRQVEVDLSKNHIKAKETKALSDDDKFKLKMNQVKAYGTTMLGAMLYNNKIIVIELGDGGAFIVNNKNEVSEAVEDDEDAVANITYSMCGDNVYEHMHGAIYKATGIKAIVISTDGVVNPYQSYDNLYEAFIKPISSKMKENRADEIDSFITDLGLKSGIGDDVSLGIITR